VSEEQLRLVLGGGFGRLLSVGREPYGTHRVRCPCTSTPHLDHPPSYPPPPPHLPPPQLQGLPGRLCPLLHRAGRHHGRGHDRPAGLRGAATPAPRPPAPVYLFGLWGARGAGGRRFAGPLSRIWRASADPPPARSGESAPDPSPFFLSPPPPAAGRPPRAQHHAQLDRHRADARRPQEAVQQLRPAVPARPQRAVDRGGL
jgi:hypothetical protein